MLDKRCFATFFNSDCSGIMIAEFKTRQEALRAIKQGRFKLHGESREALFTGETFRRWELEDWNNGLRPVKE